MVFAKVAAVLTAVAELDEDEITPGTELSKANGIDAFTLAKLVIDWEKMLQVTIWDEDVQGFKCVGDVVRYIENAREEASPGRSANPDDF